VLLVVANAVATLLRFVLFRGWVFAGRRRSQTRDGGAGLEPALAVDTPTD
jgi:hypothetical protein